MGTFTASDRNISPATLKVICNLLGYGPDAVLDIVIDARRVDVHLIETTGKRSWVHHGIDWTEANGADSHDCEDYRTIAAECSRCGRKLEDEPPC